MVDSVNLGNVRVDDDTGRVSFSGISSGINSEEAIKNIMKAYRIPTDRIEAEISSNQTKIGGLEDLKALLTNLKSAADSLRGKPTVNNAGNVFEQKEAYAATTRSDGGTTSAATSLIGVTLTNNAEVGTHRFEVIQRATQFQAATVNTWDMATELGTQIGGLSATTYFQLKASNGTVDWNGTGTTTDKTDDAIQIEILSTDTLANIRDKINAANVGESASGVTASIIQTAGSQGQLVLTADETGTAVQYNRISGNALDRLNLTEGGGGGSVNQSDPSLNGANRGFANIMTRGEQAILELTDVPDTDQGWSTGLVDAAGTVATGTLNFYRSEAPAQNIVIGNAGVDNTVADYQADADWTGTTGYTNADGEAYRYYQFAGNRYLVMDTTHDASGDKQMNFYGVRFSADPSTLTQAQFEAQMGNMNRRFSVGMDPETPQVQTDLNLNQQSLQVTRESNTITDLYQGVTLDLLKAEAGTTIELEVQRDLAGVKDAISGFAEAYNEVVKFLNMQREEDPQTGKPIEEAVLANSSILNTVESQLSLMMSQTPAGSGLDFNTLKQIGVEFVVNDNTVNTIEYDTLTIDNSVLDNMLLTEFNSVRGLFEFQHTSNDARLNIISYTGDTNFADGGGISFELDAGIPDNTGIPSVQYTYNGTTYSSAAGDIEIDGRVFKVTNGPAEGLIVRYSGRMPTSAADPVAAFDSQMTNTIGLGSLFYYDIEDMLDSQTGTVSAEINALKEQNEVNQERVADQLARLDDQRQTLIDQFNRMEAAMANLKSIQQQVQEAFGAMSSK